MNHVIRTDETLPRLAARYYGDWTLWVLIADANRLDRRAPLTPGRAIRILKPMSSDTTHTVAEGDSYESLALQYYGTEHYSGRIRTANNHAIIYESAGQSFRIPALADPVKLQAMGVFIGS